VTVGQMQTTAGKPVSSFWDWQMVLLSIYSLGVATTLIFFFRKLWIIHQLKQTANFYAEANYKFYSLNEKYTAFSFFNSIFIGNGFSEEEKKYILIHEREHCRRKHSYDLLIFEILRVLLWFHPLVYASQKSVVQVHEFQADAAVCKNGNTKNYIHQLLNSAFDSRQFSMAPSFFDQLLIKKRIMMLQQKTSKNQIKNYLVLIPLLAGMLFYIGCTSDKESVKNPENNEFRVSLDTIGPKNDFKNLIERAETADKNNRKIIIFFEPDKELLTDATNEMKLRSLKFVHKTFLNSQKGKKTTTKTEPRERTISDSLREVVIDQIPENPTGIEYFKPCNGKTGKEYQQCWNICLDYFLRDNVTTEKFKNLDLTGRQRATTQFLLSKNGELENIKVRSASPVITEEIKRVLNKVPKTKPMTKNGKPIDKLLSIPIWFNMD